MSRFKPLQTKSLAVLCAFLLSGCGQQRTLEALLLKVPGMSGTIAGGQQPVTGATVQLYAVGTSGDQSAATPLLSAAVTSDSTGSFNISGLYTCPTPTTLVYLTATGGNPGLSAGTNNSAITLMAALGRCQTLLATNPVPYFVVNEVSTVAAVAALKPYMSSLANVGSGTSDAAALATAFTLASEFANTNGAVSPGTGVPSTLVVPTAQIDTLANVVAACVNSTGGVAGDSSACGTLFADSNSPTTPTTVIGALLNIFANPTNNIAGLLGPGAASAHPSSPRSQPRRHQFAITASDGFAPGRL